MIEQLNLVTGLTEHERKKLFSWVASLPEDKIIEIFQDGVKRSFQLKGKANALIFPAGSPNTALLSWQSARGAGTPLMEKVTGWQISNSTTTSLIFASPAQQL
jgi:hypothetical protein